MRIKVLSGGRKNIELSLSDAELNFQMRRIGIEETVPMCRLVEVSEKDNPLHRFEGQTVNMDEVNFFAKRMESLTEYERKVLSAYAEDYGVATMKDLINLTFSMKGLSLLTDFSDARQVGVRLYMDEFLGMSEEEKEQTNFIEFAEKTLKESRVEVLPYGVFVEHGFEMLEVYNGKTFPAFVASEETVAVVEVQNKTGDTEYLYLPTDICSMNKVKERLQVQDYWEMEVIEIENLRLPDILVPTTEDLREVEQLTLFNEMCHAVKRFDEVKMNQLAMVVEFTGLCDFPDVAYIATHLGEFEINPLVHNDEEYGKFLVTESGLFDVDELLLPHINYASFAADKRVGTLVTSGYVEEGFVGAIRPIEEYGQYKGEFAEPLEIDYDCFEKFCLYSPLTANLMVEDVDEGNLYPSDLTQYAEAIAEAIATITANIVDLDRNPPPNPVADDRNDSYNAGNAIIPANPQKTSASWSVWRPWWKEKWVWHSDWKWKTGSHTEECEEDCESSHGYWEDEGEYVDEGWWEFSLDRYSASLSATMDLTTDAKSPTATATTIKSGYGVNISVNASASTGQSSATTPPQTAVSYFPEFYYKTYWRLLDRTRSGYHAGFEFRNNHYSTYNRRTHFTPVWMPNGTYTVYTYLLDCWTPDGMLSVNLTDSVQISGDLWDDWHIAPQRAR